MLKTELLRLIKKGIATNIKIDFDNRTIEAYFPPVLESNKIPPVYYGDSVTRLLNLSEEDLIIFQNSLK